MIDTSTSDPGTSRGLAQKLAAAGHGLLDAPVSRLPRESQQPKRMVAMPDTSLSIDTSRLAELLSELLPGGEVGKPFPTSLSIWPCIGRLDQPGSWRPRSIHKSVGPHTWRLRFERVWRDLKVIGGAGVAATGKLS